MFICTPHDGDSTDDESDDESYVETDDTDDVAWLERSFEVEDFIRLRALLALEGEFPKDGKYTKV